MNKVILKLRKVFTHIYLNSEHIGWVHIKKHPIIKSDFLEWLAKEGDISLLKKLLKEDFTIVYDEP